MGSPNIGEVIQALFQADEQGNPASIFRLLSEHSVWDSAETILNDPAYHHQYGPTLLQAIGMAFPHLEDRTALCTTLLHALQSTSDSLVYEAACSIILSYAKEWEDSFARKCYKIFEKGYEDTIDGGDQFIARLALEGIVMLPMYRADDGLLHRAIGLLLDEFPPIPSDPGDPAYLSVKALKLLGRCYDHYPQDNSIATMVQQTIGCANYAVDTEARFIFGVIKLYDAFRTADERSFLGDLRTANEFFNVAATSGEGRTDAELFSTIIQCYLLVLENAQPSMTAQMIRQANEILTERFFSFGGAEVPAFRAIESRLVQLVSFLERWVNMLREATQWPDLKPPLKILSEIYAAVRQFEVTEGLIGKAGQATYELVMLPHMQGRFVQIQEVTAKLSSILSDQAWRVHTSKAELEFYELLLQEVKAVSSPKDLTATELEKIRVAAERVAPPLADLLSRLQEQGEEASDILVQLAWQLFDRESAPLDGIPVAEGPAADICTKLLRDLKEPLGWDEQSARWRYLQVAIRLTAQYFVRMYRATPGEADPEDVRFLFAVESGGLGKKAVEKDLESHFYKTMCVGNWWGAIRRQEIGAAPGRPDLLFRFHDDIVFPIEVKREATHIEPGYIHDHYVTQAQSYGGGTQRVSFLFVLDLTTKKIGTPLPNVVDCCSLTHRVAPNELHPDYVIVWVFPANRHLPSAHSWARRKKGSAS